MAVEIERKFLVRNENWRSSVEDARPIQQGYLADGGQTTVRVRRYGDLAYLTLKGASSGISRLEFEYRIPLADAEVMLRELAGTSLIEKTRYRVRCGDHVWDLDVFEGDNAGLVLAEVELDAEDAEFERPDWAGEEVSDDPRYFNASLARHPYQSW